MAAGVVLHLCGDCRPAATDDLAEALAAERFALPVRLVPGGCMNGCATPVSLALQGPGRATCFFAGVDPVADRADIIATLHAYIAAPQGWITDARACGRLRYCLKGRVPAL